MMQRRGTSRTGPETSIALRPRAAGHRRGGTGRAGLDGPVVLVSPKPTLSTDQTVSGTVVVTTGSEPLSRKGDPPLPRLKVAHR